MDHNPLSALQCHDSEFASVVGAEEASPPSSSSGSSEAMIGFGFNIGCSARGTKPCGCSPLACCLFLSCFSITCTESSTVWSLSLELEQPIFKMIIVLSIII